jgi:phosphate:Na+ symporter
MATQNAVKEMAQMAILSKDTLDSSLQALLTKDKDMIMTTINNEQRINLMEKEIFQYLVALSNTPLNAADRQMIDSLFHTINDIERIGDHAENISDLATAFIDNELQFDEASLSTIHHAHERIMTGIDLVIASIQEGNLEKAHQVIAIEKEFDGFEASSRNNIVGRMNHGETSIDTGLLLLDMLSNLERVSDHFKNIAQVVVRLDGQTRFSALAPAQETTV